MTSALPEFVLLDGGLGTELDRRGVDIGLPLWSANALLKERDQQTLYEIHCDYLAAGADAITTNTFRTHERNTAGKVDAPAAELTHRAVDIAGEARRTVNPNALIFGSVSPLADSYKPDDAPDEQTCYAEHTKMIRTLIEAGVDYVLIETMTTVREARAAAKAASEIAPDRWLLCCCMSNQKEEAGRLISGEPIDPLFELLDTAAGFGVNCTAAPRIAANLECFADAFAPAPPGLRRMCYANTGWLSNNQWTQTDAEDPQVYARYAERWLELGATIIGGCCGTTPEHIRAINDRLNVVTP